MKSLLLFGLLLVLSIGRPALAQTPVDTTGGRFYQPKFPTVTVTSGVLFFNRGTGLFIRNVIITNNTAGTLATPIRLVLMRLRSDELSRRLLAAKNVEPNSPLSQFRRANLSAPTPELDSRNSIDR